MGTAQEHRDKREVALNLAYDGFVDAFLDYFLSTISRWKELGQSTGRLFIPLGVIIQIANI